jgi:hypothetical protein
MPGQPVFKPAHIIIEPGKPAQLVVHSNEMLKSHAYQYDYQYHCYISLSVTLFQ